jgi:hypothetical protein
MAQVTLPNKAHPWLHTKSLDAVIGRVPDWLLAIVAAREASRLRSFRDDTEWQQEHVWGQDGH